MDTSKDFINTNKLIIKKDSKGNMGKKLFHSQTHTKYRFPDHIETIEKRLEEFVGLTGFGESFHQPNENIED